jgi:hypothetical protein
MRSIEELNRDAKRILHGLRAAGWTYGWIKENVRLHVTAEEAAELMAYREGRMTLTGDSSPARLTLAIYGLKLTTTDIEYITG